MSEEGILSLAEQYKVYMSTNQEISFNKWREKQNKNNYVKKKSNSLAYMRGDMVFKPRGYSGHKSNIKNPILRELMGLSPTKQRRNEIEIRKDE